MNDIHVKFTEWRKKQFNEYINKEKSLLFQSEAKT